jgi:hypothetical protein
LPRLEPGQQLILYISASHIAISGVLVQEKEVTKNGKTTKQQFPVYFVSEIFTIISDGVQEVLFQFVKKLLCNGNEWQKASPLFQGSHNMSIDKPTFE